MLKTHVEIQSFEWDVGQLPKMQYPLWSVEINMQKFEESGCFSSI